MSQSNFKGVVAGGLTGAIEICITYPTEYVKTQLQLDNKTETFKRYTGAFDCIRQTLRDHGPLGMYRGLSVLFYCSVPKSAIRFGSFEELKRIYVSKDGTLTSQNKLLCGLGAGIAEAVFVVTPQETIKVKFINDQISKAPKYRGFLHGLSLIIKQEGLSGIYKGLYPTILKQGTNQAIRFYCMETQKELYREYYGLSEGAPVPVIITGLFGLVAGAASVIGNTPLDVIKTRMQGLDAKSYGNVFQCARKILREEGLLAFYKGTLPRMSRVCLDVCISFMIYDEVVRIFNRYWPDNHSPTK